VERASGDGQSFGNGSTSVAHPLLKYAAVFVMLFTIGIGNVWGGKITLTQSSLGLTESYTSGTEKTVDGVTFVYTNLMKNGDNIQAKASTGVIYNKTAMPGNITEIKVTHSGTERSTTVYYGTTAQPTTNSNTFSGSQTISVSGSNKYFEITRGINAAYWTSIEITYADMTPATVTLMDNSKTITEASAGAGVTLPSRAGCTGYTFAGWTKTWTEEQDEWTTTAPTIIPAGSYTPSANENLYPVYTKTESGGGTTTETYGFENSDDDTNWNINGPVQNNTYHATGSYSGKINTNHTYIAYRNKVKVTNFSFKFARSSTNSNYKVYIETSTDNSNWTAATTYPMSDFSNGSFTSKSQNFDGETELYVRFHCYNTTATRYVDDVSITYSGGSTTSYISVHNCCSPLGAINGSVNLSQSGTSVTIKNWGYTQGIGAAESNIANYTVKLYSNADSYASAVKTDTCTVANRESTGVTFTGLDYGTTYKIKINATGNSGYCDIGETTVGTINSVSTETFQLTCDVPTNVAASSVTSSSATVSWDDVATNYEYVLDQSSSNPAGAGTAVYGAHLVNLSTLTASTTYYFHVRTKCATGVYSSWASTSFTTSAAACVNQFSLHTGTQGGSDWVYNKCFVDAVWGASDDAIYVGEFPSTNECYVGYAGSNSYHGAYWAVGGIKTYDLPNGRTLGWNSDNYYSHYPATAPGTFHIYKNSTEENYYLRFKPTSYVLRTGSDGTSWTSRDMTVSGINSNYYESDFVTLTSTLISEHAYVDLKANNGDGHVWCNFSNDRTASGNVKVKNGASTFRATDLQASDNGTYGKFQIDITQDVDNWKLAFVPYFHITYNANGGTGSTAASSYVEVGSTAAAAANGFTAPAHTSFGGWATSAANAAAGTVAYAAGANITLTADVELFAIWTPEANATITLNNYSGSATTTGYYAGDSFTLPSTNSYSCNDKTFVGWSTVEIATPSATKPASNFYEPGASVTLNATNTFYAVFAEIDGNANEFTKVTDASTLADGDNIIIVSTGTYRASGKDYTFTKAMKGKNSSNTYFDDEDVTISTNTVTLGDSSEVVIYTLQANSNKWKIYNGENYLVSGDKSLNNGNSSSGTSFSISITNGNATISDGTYSLQYNPNSGANSRFACYSSTQKAVMIFRNEFSYTNYSTNCVACNEVTVSYTAPGSGNAMTVKKGSTTISSGDAVKTCSDVDLTVTLTPAAHYTVTGLSAKIDSTDMDQSHTGNVYTVTIPADATGTLSLNPTFTAEEPIEITFDVSSVSGVTAGSIGTIYSGDSFTFPDVSGVPVGFCADFLGWIDAPNGSTFEGDGTTTTAPAGLITAGTNSGAITTNKTYKAVYGERESSESDVYQKVTEEPADWSGDHYLIVCEDQDVAFDGSLSTLDAVSNYVAVTITNGVIAYSSSLAASEFKIATMTGGYSIQSASGVYIGQTSDANGIATSTSDPILNILDLYSDDDWDVASSSAQLMYNATSGQTRFRYFKSSTYTNQTYIQLYKKGVAVVNTYTYTTAPSCGDKYRVTVADATGGTPSASPRYCADGTTISLVANPANGYGFTSWTITRDDNSSDVTSTLLGANSTTASTSFTMPAYDVTVTATYALATYTITYNNLNGATNTGNLTSYNVTTADIVFADPGERSGYVFKGWYDDAVYTNMVTGISNGSTGDVTVYAKWAVGYTVTWQNGVGSTNPTPTGIEDGQAIGTLPVPTGSCELNGVEYSNFVGWYTGTIADVADDPSEAGTLITSATMPNGNVTYHAVYTNMPDYSGTHTSNVTLPSQSGVIYTAKVKVDDADDAPQYDAIKIGSSSTKTSSFNFTVPSGTTRITVQGAGWNGKTTSITLATSVGTISPSTAQSLEAQSGASNNSPFTITLNTTLTFNLTGVTSEATITLSNSGERVVVWGINASSASGSEIGYITQCCDNMLAAPTMNTPTVQTSTAITLSWNAVTNATGYKVSWNGGNWEDVETATTYAKTSLEPATDYAYKVIAKYTTPYCGATPVEGVVSTKPVYSVTYQRGTGTGSCSATGTIPAIATYEAGATVTLVANPFSLSGNTFTAWEVKDADDNDVTVTNNQFTMPESDVTVTATWTAVQDKYFDRMHDGTSAANGGILETSGENEGKYYLVREGCNYTVPALTDDTDGDTECHTSHYKLLGWIAASHLNAAGEVKAGEESYIFTGGGQKTATGATYFAVWAVVQ